MTPQRIAWPHAPTHRLSTQGTYIVTAGTYQKAHHFRGRDRVAVLHRGLLSVANRFNWQLEAWSVFSNHYHFVGHSPETGADNLAQMLSLLHEKTAKWLNKLDRAAGREVWHNFWETSLTHKNSYLARLNYVHQNAVKHGLVSVANQYQWCSAAWFERTASPSAVKTILYLTFDGVEAVKGSPLKKFVLMSFGASAADKADVAAVAMIAIAIKVRIFGFQIALTASRAIRDQAAYAHP